MELFKGDAVKFFGIDAQIVAPARTELSHIPVQRNTDDWLWRTDDDSFLHFEFQSDYNKNDLARFMVSDAMLYFKEGKPIKTIVVYSAEIKDTITTLDIGAIQYNVEAFYMSALDGDKTYDDIKLKVEAGKPLTKNDLMSIVFLPLMKNSIDKTTRFEQVAMLSTDLTGAGEQAQVQGMIGLLAEKFIADRADLKRVKELMNMGIIFEMMREDGVKEGAIESAIKIAKNLLKKGSTIEFVAEVTGMGEAEIRDLQAALSQEPA
jgi:predicted transposase/invertase (TIGR01784 family)